MRPSIVAAWLFSALLPRGVGNDVLSDLHEEYLQFKRPEMGQVRARLWYWRQIIGSLIRYRARRLDSARKGAGCAPSSWGQGWRLGSVSQDVRHAVRALRRSPGLSATAIVALALGIGAISATFSFASSLLLYEPAVEEPQQLVRLFIAWAEETGFGGWSYPDYADFRDRNDVFSGLVAEGVRPLHLSHDGDNTRIWGSIVSGNYFSELGVEPSLGRGFVSEEDETRGTHPVVVLGHALWRSHFGADRGMLGEQIILNGHPFTVIGVGPEGFAGTNVGVTPDLWVPLMMLDVLVPAQEMLGARAFQGIPFVIGRLKTGVSIEQARRSTAALMDQIAQENPNASLGKRVRLLREGEAGLHPMVRGPIVRFFGLTFGVVGLILLLTCANVAGLLLARSLTRGREMGIRMALGASRFRLVRQLMTESLVLAVLAGGVGLLLAHWLIDLVMALKPSSTLPIDWTVTIDAGVLMFAFLAAALTALLFGLAPALHAAGWEIVSALKGGSVSPGGRSNRARTGLIICQLALSLTLLIGAGMAVRSLARVMNVDLGFDPEDVLVTAIDLELQGYEPHEARDLLRALKERVGTLPGVEAVGLAQRVPLSLTVSKLGVLPEGYELADGSPRPAVDYNVVDAEYFDALRIRLLRGRGLTEGDDENAPAAMVINETFAERFWPGQDPLGKRVQTLGREHRVVGVVSNGKYMTIGEEPLPYSYLSLYQVHRSAVVLHVRSPAGSTSLARAIRLELTALDETLPIADLQTMDSAMGFALLPARMAASVVTGLAAVALLLASIGLYGVISSTVNQGLHDIGVRMALGASAKDVVILVLRQGIVLTAAGLVFGLIGGYALARLMTALLYGVTATDILAYFPAAMLLAGVALLSSLLPARRAGTTTRWLR